jgi:hypothetical protein
MHTDVIKIIFDPEEFASFLDIVYLLEGDFLVYNENYVLLRLRLIMEASSDIIRTSVNARVVSLFISRVSKVYFSKECRFQ